MTTLTRFSALGAVSLLAFAGLAVQPSPQPAGTPAAVGAPRSQPKPTPTPTPAPTPAPSPSGGEGDAGGGAGERTPRFNLEFPGGEVREYVAMLRDVAGPAANVVVSLEAEHLTLGSVSLKLVTVPDAVQVIETGRRWDGNMLTTLRVEQRGGVFLVNASRTRSAVGAPGMGAQDNGGGVAVFNISGPSGPSTPPEVTLSAVEAAVTLISKPGEEAKISFHRDSGLLFVVANEQVMESVRNVVRGIGANRQSMEQQQELATAGELVAMLSVANLEAAKSRVKELLDWRKGAEAETLELSKRLAGREARAEAMEREMLDLRDRAAKQAEEARREEQLYRAMLDKAREAAASEIRGLRAELEDAKAKLRAEGTKK